MKKLILIFSFLFAIAVSQASESSGKYDYCKTEICSQDVGWNQSEILLPAFTFKNVNSETQYKNISLCKGDDYSNWTINNELQLPESNFINQRWTNHLPDYGLYLIFNYKFGIYGFNKPPCNKV